MYESRGGTYGCLQAWMTALAAMDFWGRPTVIISWGKALQTTDAINILREKEDTTMDIEEDSFLTRF